MQPRKVVGREQVFQDAMKCWDELKLRDSFIEACDKFPKGSCCCGLLTDDDTTIKKWVPQLNETWVKSTNKTILEHRGGFKIECFHWNWQNASGKAETNIFLIRFYEMSSYRLRKASLDDDFDFEVVEIDDNGIIENRSTEIITQQIPEILLPEILVVPMEEMAR